jgi:hypothetical protein
VPDVDWNTQLLAHARSFSARTRGTPLPSWFDARFESASSATNTGPNAATSGHTKALAAGPVARSGSDDWSFGGMAGA